MSLQERFCNGIYMASNSFAMLWISSEVISLSWFCCSFFFAQILVYNMPMIDFAGDELTLYIGMQGLAIFINRIYALDISESSCYYICLCVYYHFFKYMSY